jgi:hypothetical protein
VAIDRVLRHSLVGVVVLLTDSGLDRLTVVAPVHLLGVSDLFVANLDDQELAVLESALAMSGSRLSGAGEVRLVPCSGKWVRSFAPRLSEHMNALTLSTIDCTFG